MHTTLASGLVDWEKLTGQSKLVVDLVSIPIFSAIAGVITNWTGVIMLFAPVRFHGFHCPGLKTIFPFLPRKVQILPTFAPGGILGFQGFIPARAEKMASICADKGFSLVGNISDFYKQLDPDGIAEQLVLLMQPEVRTMVDGLMEREHPQFWADLPSPLKEVVYQRVAQRLPGIAHRAFEALGENIDHLIDVKLLTVNYLRRHPEVLVDFIKDLGAKELKFMVRVGFEVGGPLGLLLALFLQVKHSIPLISAVPSSVFVIFGAALIGIIVNIIAIKVVFEPGLPAPRYRYIWKQAKFAKRQHEAAKSFAASMAYRVLTLPNLANELLHGPRAQQTRRLLETVLASEMDDILGPVRGVVRVAVGTKEYDAIRSGTATAVLDFAPALVGDADFSKRQAKKIHKFATKKLRALPPDEFMVMLYSAIEQDAWLLYLHGGLLGFAVGFIHLLLFGS